jgi:hypothetical protein
MVREWGGEKQWSWVDDGGEAVEVWMAKKGWRKQDET